MPTIAFPLLPEELAIFCRRNHTRHLGVFGSFARGEAGPDSDIDLLVEFEPEARVSVFTLVYVQDDLAEMLGRRVDLSPRSGLKPPLRDQILATTIDLYAK
jgi:hypothetical protein